MTNHDYLLVVRTEGIDETATAPPDAVVSASYWHPGDRDWVHTYHSSVDGVIADILADGDWKLVQRVDLRGPYEHELIFSCRRTDFDDVRDRPTSGAA